MEILQSITENIINGKAKLISDLVDQALEQGIEPRAVLDTMIEAMSIVGEKFSKQEIFVPEMLVSARTMKKGVKTLKPHLAEGAVGDQGKMIIGTVEGDLHDIGKNLVVMMIESAGFEVIDLGVDVAADAFIEAIRENPDVKLVGLSALLSTTMPAMEDIVAKLNAQDFRPNIKIMIGGAPVTAEFAKKIGADAYTEDAVSAADMAKKLVS